MAPFVGPLPAHIVGWFLALVLGGGAAAWLMVRAGMSDRAIAWSMLPRIAALFVGSKLLYLVEVQERWWGNPSAFLGALFSPQMRLPGGVLLLVAIAPLTSRAIGVRSLFLADTVAPAAGLLILGIRIGCFLEGCCHGSPTSMPWGVVFPAASPAGLWQASTGVVALGATPLAVHPLQLYFALAGVLIFAALTAYQPRKRYEGEIILLLGLSYLWSTWLLEHLRARPHELTQDVVLAAALALTACAAIVEWRRRAQTSVSSKLDRR